MPQVDALGRFKLYDLNGCTPSDAVLRTCTGAVSLIHGCPGKGTGREQSPHVELSSVMVRPGSVKRLRAQQ